MKRRRLLWRAERFLQEFLNLVGVGFHLAPEQQERRLSPRCQVLQDVWFPVGGGQEVRKKQKTKNEIGRGL